MRVWIFQIGQRYNTQVDDRRIFSNLLEEAVLAEELGFEGVWAAEHHFTNYASITSPLLYLASVAQRTTTLRLGSMAVVLPLHNPVRVAEEAAMLDNLSNGRVEVGVARGYSDYEYDGLGVSLKDSKKAMEEGLDVIVAALSDTDVAVDSGIYLNESRTVTPRPYQRPFSKLWYACSSESTIDTALDRDMNVIQSLGVGGIGRAEKFAEALAAKIEAHGVSRSAVRYGAQMPVHICHSEEETAHAVEQARFMYRMAGQLTQNTQSVKAGFFQPPSEPVASAEVSIEQCVSGNMIGSPDHAQEIMQRMESLGVTDLSLNFEFGDFTHEQRCESLREVAKALELSPSAAALQEASQPV